MIGNAVGHLAAALRLLDRAGATLPAVHVDAALNSLSDGLGERLRELRGALGDEQDIDLSALDSLVNAL